jgi:hypothetical protein
MLRFALGVIAGALLAFGFVRFDIAPPSWFGLPERLRGNLVSTATEAALYDLGGDGAEATRALEVYFANRPADAAALDAASGHPFLTALRRTRATREARQVLARWEASDAALAQPALRAALERRHGVRDTHALKEAMLAEALSDMPFLAAWLEATIPGEGTTLEALRAAARDPGQP